MNEKNNTGSELTLEESGKDFGKTIEKVDEYYEKEKSPLWKKFDSYQKNLLSIQDVADRLLSRMKGHGVSFKPEITDRKGKFSREKLSGFVDGLLSRWAEKQRDSTFIDPCTGESMAEPYIRARQELYGCYLYLVMRCSLCKDGYFLVTHNRMEERTDFAFLLEQAKWLLRGWCVMEREQPDGSKKKENEMFWGYDSHFGFHLYRVISCPAAGYDNRLSEVESLPADHPDFLTDEGNVKWNQFQVIYGGRRPALLAGKAKKAAQPDEDGYDDENSYDMEDSYDDGNGYDEDSYDIEGSDDGDGYYNYDDGDVDDAIGWQAEDHYDDELNWQMEIDWLVQAFEYRDEYVKKCERFVELFRKAGHDVLREFCGDLEEIVALYLIERDIPPVMDTDKALDVYGGIYDGPYRRAGRYAGGIQ